MDNNSTYVPGMNNSADSNFNPYAQPNTGSGTVIPGMQPNRMPTPEPNVTPQANGAPVVGFLYSISNGGNREYWPIHVGTNIIGREDSADITLREATVSSRHAEIRVRELRTGNGLTATIQDLGSKTGILINDTDPGYDLQKCCNGDILTIGENYRLLVIFVDTAANGLNVSPNFMPIAEQKEEETEIPSFGKGVNPYDRNLRSSQPGTVNLSGNDPIINAGGTMIME